ncbi:hypothetical protein KMW28_23545 [Flammeovirga yaeyamensis]|uniref:Uncharacterized protein n=1 Tax=Flammeovirga yaeyamensis TaxID=367791 RepID=A0AAX1ND35_9BACT|nr:hypothetical protein [Flammeovirga yaeyamensis]MBB3696653.1 hypothetical protein [Flammeovirga yaeyamensis]NMF33326.1 hypothetical protein [Flammeovirga yaeyamensis]QWG05397.1 hypothetical protein KMW28_23545 [Flammeovirga yaeyamensis]
MKKLFLSIVALIAFVTVSNAQTFNVGDTVRYNGNTKKVYVITKSIANGKRFNLKNAKTGNQWDGVSAKKLTTYTVPVVVVSNESTQTVTYDINSKPDALDYAHDYKERKKVWRSLFYVGLGGATIGAAIASAPVVGIGGVVLFIAGMGELHTNPIRNNKDKVQRAPRHLR